MRMMVSWLTGEANIEFQWSSSYTRYISCVCFMLAEPPADGSGKHFFIGRLWHFQKIFSCCSCNVLMMLVMSLGFWCPSLVSSFYLLCSLSDYCTSYCTCFRCSVNAAWFVVDGKRLDGNSKVSFYNLKQPHFKMNVFDTGCVLYPQYIPNLKSFWVWSMSTKEMWQKYSAQK